MPGRRRATLPPIAVIDLTEESPQRIVHEQNTRNQRTRRGRHHQQTTDHLTSDWSITDVDDSRETMVYRDTINLTENETTAVTVPFNPELEPIPLLDDSTTGLPTPLTCAICFNALMPSREPTATRCGHVFCGGCLKAAMENRKKCPKCNSSITVKTCIRLYF